MLFKETKIIKTCETAVAKQKLKTLLLSCGTIDWCGFYPSNLATHEYCVRNNIPHGWLSVKGGSAENNANVIQYARKGNQNQRWYFIATSK